MEPLRGSTLVFYMIAFENCDLVNFQRIPENSSIFVGCKLSLYHLLTMQVMRYSPYVTYGHQGLTLGQNPAQALSGDF